MMSFPMELEGSKSREKKKKKKTEEVSNAKEKLSTSSKMKTSSELKKDRDEPRAIDDAFTGGSDHYYPSEERKSLLRSGWSKAFGGLKGGGKIDTSKDKKKSGKDSKGVSPTGKVGRKVHVPPMLGEHVPWEPSTKSCLLTKDSIVETMASCKDPAFKFTVGNERERKAAGRKDSSSHASGDRKEAVEEREGRREEERQESRHGGEVRDENLSPRVVQVPSGLPARKTPAAGPSPKAMEVASTSTAAFKEALNLALPQARAAVNPALSRQQQERAYNKLYKIITDYSEINKACERHRAVWVEDYEKRVAEAKVKYANKRGALRDALSAITKPDTHYPPHHIRTDHLTDEMMGKARHLLKAVVNDDAVRSLPEAEPKSGERKLTKWIDTDRLHKISQRHNKVYNSVAVRITGDGYCMYHSLLRGIGEKEHDNMGHVHKVKLHTALQPLLHRREAFLDKYDAESSRENLHYQNAMRALVPGAWSGCPQIKAAAVALKVNVETVYPRSLLSPDYATWEEHDFKFQGHPSGKDKVTPTLMWTKVADVKPDIERRANHFVALVDMPTPTSKASRQNILIKGGTFEIEGDLQRMARLGIQSPFVSDKLSKMESFYEKELQTKAEEGQDLKSEVKTLKASANERISILNEELKTREVRLENQRARIEVLEKDLTSSTSASSFVQKHISDIGNAERERELRVSLQRIHEAAAEKTRLEEELEKVKHDIDEVMNGLKKEKADRKEDTENAQREAVTTKKKLLQAVEDLKDRDFFINNLKEELKKAKADGRDAISRLDKANDIVKDLRSATEARKAQESASRDIREKKTAEELEQARREKEEALTGLEKAKQELESLRKERDVSSAERESDGKAGTADDEVFKARDEIARLQSLLQSKDEDLKRKDEFLEKAFSEEEEASRKQAASREELIEELQAQIAKAPTSEEVDARDRRIEELEKKVAESSGIVRMNIELSDTSDPLAAMEEAVKNATDLAEVTRLKQKVKDAMDAARRTESLAEKRMTQLRSIDAKLDATKEDLEEEEISSRLSEIMSGRDVSEEEMGVEEEVLLPSPRLDTAAVSKLSKHYKRPKQVASSDGSTVSRDKPKKVKMDDSEDNAKVDIGDTESEHQSPPPIPQSSSQSKSPTTGDNNKEEESVESEESYERPVTRSQDAKTEQDNRQSNKDPSSPSSSSSTNTDCSGSGGARSGVSDIFADTESERDAPVDLFSSTEEDSEDDLDEEEEEDDVAEEEVEEEPIDVELDDQFQVATEHPFDDLLHAVVRAGIEGKADFNQTMYRTKAGQIVWNDTKTFLTNQFKKTRHFHDQPFHAKDFKTESKTGDKVFAFKNSGEAAVRVYPDYHNPGVYLSKRHGPRIDIPKDADFYVMTYSKFPSAIKLKDPTGSKTEGPDKYVIYRGYLNLADSRLADPDNHATNVEAWCFAKRVQSIPRINEARLKTLERLERREERMRKKEEAQAQRKAKDGENRK